MNFPTRIPEAPKWFSVLVLCVQCVPWLKKQGGHLRRSYDHGPYGSHGIEDIRGGSLPGLLGCGVWQFSGLGAALGTWICARFGALDPRLREYDDFGRMLFQEVFFGTGHGACFGAPDICLRGDDDRGKIPYGDDGWWRFHRGQDGSKRRAGCPSRGWSWPVPYVVPSSHKLDHNTVHPGCQAKFQLIAEEAKR